MPASGVSFMSKYILSVFLIILFIIIVGCGMSFQEFALGARPPGRTIESTSHPAYPKGIKCYVCHKEDRLQEEFHLKYSINCEECHRLTTWMAYDYHHEEWELGTHRKMHCNKCHTEMALYVFSSYQCFGCHHDETVITEEHKARGYSDISNCIRCHTGSETNNAVSQGNVSQ